jgi:hypothetical protein
MLEKEFLMKIGDLQHLSLILQRTHHPWEHIRHPDDQRKKMQPFMPFQ